MYPALALIRSLTLECSISKKWPHTIIIGYSKSLSERLANIMGFNFAGVNRNMKRASRTAAYACIVCAVWILYSLVVESSCHDPHCTLTHSRSFCSYQIKHHSLYRCNEFWCLVFSLLIWVCTKSILYIFCVLYSYVHFGGGQFRIFCSPLLYFLVFMIKLKLFLFIRNRRQMCTYSVSVFQ